MHTGRLTSLTRLHDPSTGQDIGMINQKELATYFGLTKPKLCAASVAYNKASNPDGSEDENEVGSESCQEEEGRGGFDDDGDNESKGLLALWRFDEDLGAVIKDITNNNIRGVIKGKDFSLQDFKGDCPMELEDKWGKKLSQQKYLQLNADNVVMTEKKEWFRKELKAFTFEVWFYSQFDKGILLSTSDESLMVMFKNRRYVVFTGQTKMVPDIDIPIDIEDWNHIALCIDTVAKQLFLYHNGRLILKRSDLDVNIKNIGKGTLMIAPQFTGRMTELRLWKKAKDEEQVRGNLTTPLSIVNEQAAVVIVNIKRPVLDKTKRQSTVEEAKISSTPTVEEAEHPAFAGSMNFDFGAPMESGDHQDNNWGFGLTLTEVEDTQNWGAAATEALDHPTLKTEEHKDFGSFIPEPPQPTDSISSAWGLDPPPQPHTNHSEELPSDHPSLKVASPLLTHDNPTTSPRSGFQDSQPPTSKPSPDLKKPQGIIDGKIFSGIKYNSNMYYTESIENMLASQFNSLANQSAFIQKFISLYLNVVKRVRGHYLKDEYDTSLHLLDRLLTSTKEVPTT